MRFMLSIISLCTFALVRQVTAKFDNKTPGKQATDESIDPLRHDDSQGNIAKIVKDESWNATKVPQVSNVPVSQSLATYTVDLMAVCAGLRNTDEKGRHWEYTFSRARCEPRHVNKRLAKVSCHSQWNHRFGPERWHRGRGRTVPYECPVNTVCQNLGWRRKNRVEKPPEEIVCVDEADVKTDMVTPANSHADPNVPDVHCGQSLAIPGSEFTVNPGIQSIDVTLTEEARFKDGSPYPAPMLYIRDKTSWRGFDRVFEQDASVASTQVTLTAIKGKFQTKTFEFCMQLLPGLTASAVTFSYSWFQTTSRHGRIPGQFLLTHEKSNEMGLE